MEHQNVLFFDSRCKFPLVKTKWPTFIQATLWAYRCSLTCDLHHNRYVNTQRENLLRPYVHITMHAGVAEFSMADGSILLDPIQSMSMCLCVLTQIHPSKSIQQLTSYQHQSPWHNHQSTFYEPTRWYTPWILRQNFVRSTCTPSTRHEWRLYSRSLPIHIVTAKLTYASQVWSGFCTASDINKLDRFLARCKMSQRLQPDYRRIFLCSWWCFVSP